MQWPLFSFSSMHLWPYLLFTSLPPHSSPHLFSSPTLTLRNTHCGEQEVQTDDQPELSGIPSPHQYQGHMLKETSFKVILQNGDWLGKLRVRSIITIFLISKFSCALSLLFVVGFIFNHRHSGPSLFSCKSMRTSGKVHPIVQIINTLHIKQA